MNALFVCCKEKWMYRPQFLKNKASTFDFQMVGLPVPEGSLWTVFTLFASDRLFSKWLFRHNAFVVATFKPFVRIGGGRWNVAFTTTPCDYTLRLLFATTLYDYSLQLLLRLLLLLLLRLLVAATLCDYTLRLLFAITLYDYSLRLQTLCVYCLLLLNTSSFDLSLF
jgi:hypothetical protein